jgi:hypothetical protein
MEMTKLLSWNELGMDVQLNCGWIDTKHGLVAVEAMQAVNLQLIGSCWKTVAGLQQPLLLAAQPIQAKLQCTSPDDIGASSSCSDSEFKLDSSWELVRMWGEACSAGNHWQAQSPDGKKELTWPIVWQNTHALQL